MFFNSSRARRATGVQLHAFPDGFYLNDLLWYGEGGGKSIPVARGFEIIPTDPSGLGNPGLIDLRHRLQQTLQMLGTNHTMQVRWTLDSDYRAELTAYDKETSRIEAELARKEAAGEWYEADAFQVYHRRKLYFEMWQQMEKGELQRERLHLYMGSTLNVPSRNDGNREEYKDLIDRISRAEAKRLDELFGNRLRGLHADATVRAMTDADHFLRAEYFHDPLRRIGRNDTPLRRFDVQESIGLNTFTRQWRVPQGEPGVSYTEDNVPHAMLALLTPPIGTWPAEIPQMIRNLSFHEVEVIMNIRPLNPDKIAARLEKESGEATNVLKARGNLRVGENVRVDDKNERILAYRRGVRMPYAVLYTFHLWAPTVTELNRRVSDLKLMVEGWRGAGATLVCLPGSVRHTYANAWPGWWCGKMDQYFMELDDVNVADMMPWSSTFQGEPDGHEAIFGGQNNSIVFVRTRLPNGQPRHSLTIGKTGSGKTTFTNDLLMQIRHSIDFVGICESGRSLVVSSALEGVEPLVISPQGNQTLNVFDPNQNPLSHEFFAFLTSFLLGRMGIGGGGGSVGEREEVSLRRGILLENLHAMYRQNFRSLVRHNGKFIDQLRKFAVVVHNRHRASIARKREATLAEVALDVQAAIEGDDPTRQQLALEAFATVSDGELEEFSRMQDSEGLLRDLSFVFQAEHTVPTMGQFVDMLDGAPASDRSQHEICRRMAHLLRPWCARGGSYGILFDGPGTVKMAGRRFHVETGEIDEAQRELREATNAVVAGMMMQHVKRLPRAQRKLIHFPELAEVLNTAGGTEMLMLLSTQIRKYNGILSAEIQQYDLLRKSPIQATLWANCSQRYFLRQPDPDDARDLAERARLSAPHTRMVENFPAPSSAGSYFLLNVEGGVTGPAICRPSPGLLYAAESSGKVFDQRKVALRKYDSLALGIITEGEDAVLRTQEEKDNAKGINRQLAVLPGRSNAPARELLANI